MVMKSFSPTWVLLGVWLVLVDATFPQDMMSRMNDKADPCSDFYEYSCGGWIQTTRLDASQTSMGWASTINYKKSNKVFDTIINKKYPLLYDLWDSCLALDTLKEVGNRPLLEDLNRIAHAETREDLIELAGTFARTGTNLFIKLRFDPELRDATIHTVYATPPDLTLPKHYYSDFRDTKLERKYRLYIFQLMEMAVPTDSLLYQGREIANSVVEMEEKLVKLKAPTPLRTARLSIIDAAQVWPLTIGAFMKGAGLLKRDFKLYLEPLEYLQVMEKFIAMQSINDLKLYIAFVMVHSRVEWLSEEYRHLYFQMFKRLSGQQEISTRHRFCREKLIEYLPNVYGTRYMNVVFDTKQKKTTEEMFELIKHAMEDHITKAQWLDPDTINAAKNKVHHMIPLIGQSSVSRTYPALSRSNYAANVYSLLSHSFDREVDRLGQSVNRIDWPQSAATDEAFYFSYKNAIGLPAAVLQPPCFNGLKHHPALDFGAIGTIMGHEIAHGFDTTGRRFDADGTKRDWWKESSIQAFEDRAKCIQDQYSKFQVNGQYGVLGKVNGNLTLNENIADNVGVAIAWDAYRHYMTKFKPKIKDVDLDEGDRLFFLAFGQSWCRVVRDETMQHELAKDPHSPSKWRVNGVVMNNDRFAEAFKCKPNTPLNPMVKCKVW